MKHNQQARNGYITPNATFEIDGPVIVARIGNQIMGRVHSNYAENDHFGFYRPGESTWMDAFKDGRLDVNGYGFITAHVA